jgi:hypothetical protein
VAFIRTLQAGAKTIEHRSIVQTTLEAVRAFHDDPKAL